MDNSNSGIAYLKKNGIGIDKCGIGTEIHKLIYHLIFKFRNISSMTILLGI